MNRFEKNQKSGDFSNVPKEHLSYIKKPEDDQTEFPDESLLENLNSYSQNDKKQAKSHSEYLFKKAMVQQKVRAIVHQKNREQKEKEEIKQCTFKPILSPTAVTLNKNEDIVAKTKKWQKQQKEKAIKNQVHILCIYYLFRFRLEGENCARAPRMHIPAQQCWRSKKA